MSDGGLLRGHVPAYRKWYLKELGRARTSPRAGMLENTCPSWSRSTSAWSSLLAATSSPPLPRSTGRPASWWAAPGLPGTGTAIRSSSATTTTPSRAEGIVKVDLLDEGRVIGMSDCLWGLLDGVNQAGLAASDVRGPTRGGKRIRHPVGGSLPARDAGPSPTREALARLPIHAAQNVTLLDRTGARGHRLRGSRPRARVRDVPAATNHQNPDDWRSTPRPSASRARAPRARTPAGAG